MRKLKFKISVTTNPVSIFLQQMRFYQDFCKSSHQGHKVVNAFLDALNILNSLKIPKLTEDRKRICDGKKLQVECEVMLASFESNTALRNNDISGDFCRCFGICYVL